MGKVLQVVGYKKAGKTTLVCEIVRALSDAGFRVGTLKHDTHGTDPEPEGRDSRRHREAGAHVTAYASPSLTMWIRSRPEPDPDTLIQALFAEGAELAVVEGFKSAPYPKLVLLRDEEDAGLLELSGIIGVVLRQDMPGVERQAAVHGYAIFHTQGMAFDTLLAYICRWAKEL